MPEQRVASKLFKND